MSIWGSTEVAGEDENGKFTGDVVSYIEGWSNHYPGHFPEERNKYGFSKDVTQETPASISTGWIPSWCVPGHDEDDGLDVDTHVGSWLRLDIIMRTVSIWAGVEIGNQDVHSVCLNESAVINLRDNLNEWIALAKVQSR